MPMMQLPLLSSPSEAVRRRRAIIHDVTAIDLLAVAPKTAVAWWIGQFTVLQTNSSVKQGREVPPICWKAPRHLLRATRLESWSIWQRHVVKLASEATWPRQELRNRLRRNKERCQLCFVPNRHTLPPLLCVPHLQEQCSKSFWVVHRDQLSRS